MKQLEKDIIVDYLEILIYNYIKMILLFFLIILVVYLLPVYQEPRVFHDFLIPEERIYIIKKAEENLEPSTVSQKGKVLESARKSETAWLDIGDPTIKTIVMRCLQHIDQPIRNCEKLQVLRYKPGGYYKPHQDVLVGVENPRLYTFILALNDDYEGGETNFPNIGREYKLKAGDALFFDTLDNYELGTSKALHGGKPVKSGEKWICNLWVRKFPV